MGVLIRRCWACFRHDRNVSFATYSTAAFACSIDSGSAAARRVTRSRTAPAASAPVASAAATTLAIAPTTWALAVTASPAIRPVNIHTTPTKPAATTTTSPCARPYCAICGEGTGYSPGALPSQWCDQHGHQSFGMGSST